MGCMYLYNCSKIDGFRLNQNGKLDRTEQVSGFHEGTFHIL